MRYILICLAAFMLFAFPAFAADDLDVLVTVDINDLYDASWTAPDVTFTPAAADINATYMEKEQVFSGSVKTNMTWKLYAGMDAFDAPYGALYISLRLHAATETAFLAVGTVASPVEITSGGPGVAAPALDIRLDGLAWTQPNGGTPAETLKMTFTTS